MSVRILPVFQSYLPSVWMPQIYLLNILRNGKPMVKMISVEDQVHLNRKLRVNTWRIIITKEILSIKNLDNIKTTI